MDEPSLVPDSLFITKHDEEMKAVALELELSLKSKVRYKKIFSQYKEKENIWFVWYVVLNRSAGETLSELWDRYALWGDCLFAYSTLKEVFEYNFKLPEPRKAKKRRREGEMALINNKTISQKLYQRAYQVKCVQLLKNFKTACIHYCSQGVYRIKGLKCDFSISAHSLSLEFKIFYGIWSLLKKGGNPLQL